MKCLGFALTRSIVSPSVAMTDTKAVFGRHGFGGGAGMLGTVGTRSRGLELHGVLLAPIQGVVRSAILTIAVHLYIGVIARPWTAVISPLAMAHTKGIGGPLEVDTARVMQVEAYDARHAVDGRAGAAVHGSNGAARLCVVVHHDDSLLQQQQPCTNWSIMCNLAATINMVTLCISDKDLPHNGEPHNCICSCISSQGCRLKGWAHQKSLW